MTPTLLQAVRQVIGEASIELISDACAQRIGSLFVWLVFDRKWFLLGIFIR